MRFNWFQNQDNVVYADVNEFAETFGKETGVQNFREKLDSFRADPVKEGILLKGKKRTTLKLFIPDLYFDDKEEKLEMGNTVWVYMGEYYPCYCVYWPLEEANINDKEVPTYKFFSNAKCDYFPCHKAEDKASFNCMFCYCPLYALGDKCGGNYVYLDNGIKDCSHCMVPHREDSYDYITSRWNDLAKLAKRTCDK